MLLQCLLPTAWFSKHSCKYTPKKKKWNIDTIISTLRGWAMICFLIFLYDGRCWLLQYTQPLQHFTSHLGTCSKQLFWERWVEMTVSIFHFFFWLVFTAMFAKSCSWQETLKEHGHEDGLDGIWEQHRTWITNNNHGCYSLSRSGVVILHRLG